MYYDAGEQYATRGTRDGGLRHPWTTEASQLTPSTYLWTSGLKSSIIIMTQRLRQR